LSPIQTIRSPFSGEGIQEVWEWWFGCAGQRCSRSCTESRKVQTQGCDGEIGQGAREIIKTFRFGKDRRNGNCCLNGERSAHRRNESSISCENVQTSCHCGKYLRNGLRKLVTCKREPRRVILLGIDCIKKSWWACKVSILTRSSFVASLYAFHKANICMQPCRS
jgi:hypothetical protein